MSYIIELKWYAYWNWKRQKKSMLVDWSTDMPHWPKLRDANKFIGVYSYIFLRITNVFFMTRIFIDYYLFCLFVVCLFSTSWIKVGVATSFRTPSVTRYVNFLPKIRTTLNSAIITTQIRHWCSALSVFLSYGSIVSSRQTPFSTFRRNKSYFRFHCWGEWLAFKFCCYNIPMW
jgi:hypothetical protein